MPGLQHRLPVGNGGSSLPCLVQRQALLQTPALKDGKIDRRADGEEPGIPTIEVVELEGFDADPAFQADSRVEIGFGDADGCRRSMELSFGALYVRPPVRQFGGQAHRHIGRKRRQGHRFKQLRIEGARLLPSSSAKAFISVLRRWTSSGTSASTVASCARAEAVSKRVATPLRSRLSARRRVRSATSSSAG